MSVHIHSSSVVEKGAELDSGVEIGPFCHVGSEVKLGKNVKLHSHVVVTGRTTVGDGTQMFPFACIGMRPQDLKYRGEKSELIIGNNNMIREYVTMNPGTESGGMKTIIGNNGLFMANSHVAHDCRIGHDVILANSVAIAGHVVVGDSAIFGGLSAARQFVRVGAHAMVGGMTGVEQDVMPFGLVMGNRARLAGLNVIGLKRRGFTKEDTQNLREAFEILFGNASTIFAQRVQEVEAELGDSAVIKQVLDFIKADTKVGICHPQRGVDFQVDHD